MESFGPALQLRIVGLTGRARSGKDTFADVLANEYAYLKMSFADPLKNGLAAMLGITRAELDSRKEGGEQFIRHALQTLGTEWGRELMHPEFWVDCAHEKLKRFARAGQANFVFTDIRFANEAELVQRLGGVVIHALRPGGPEIQGSGHSSETPISSDLIDVGLTNNSTMAAWQRQARIWGDFMRPQEFWDGIVRDRAYRSAAAAHAS